MLRIYNVALAVAADAGGIARIIARQDSDLARQLRRAAASIALNIAEGSGQRDGNRRQRYLTALGSAEEVRACADVAQALGYVGPMGPDAASRLRQVVGTLVLLTR